VLVVSSTARILIVGQAPGTKVHASGIPWNDPSGERLRLWMGVAAADFYDAARVAIVPMGLCYPGVLPNGGDRPPDPVCAPTWHPRILPLMPQIELTLVVGTYAQARLLGKGAMTEQVRGFRAFLPRYLPLPHPSWRTVGWEKRNPWFGDEVLPVLRKRVALLME
jgi:uracil-DNA glycosylase